GGARPATDTLRAVMALALDRAGVSPRSLDLVSAFANSSREDDRVEAAALAGFVGPEVPVTAAKSMLGECMGASGALQSAAALVALESGTIPPTINTTDVDPEIEGIALVSWPVERRVRTAMIPSLDPQGASACLVIRRE